MKVPHPIAIDVRIDCDHADRANLVHRFRNYGEDLWLWFRDEGRIKIDLAVIDSSTDRFRFSATNEVMARRAVKSARELMSRHSLSGSVEIGKL